MQVSSDKGQEMATCPTCHREMLAAHSCRPRLGAIRYGDETSPPDPWPDPCRDCAISTGGIHHPGCCVEQCQVCGGQLLGCRCAAVMGATQRFLRAITGGAA